MRRAERVIFALAALGEAAQAPAHAKRADAVAAAGDDLVRIGLVADVPDQGVGGRVEHMVERDGQLDHAQAGAEVPPGDRHRRNHLGAKFLGQLGQLVLGQRANIGGRIDGVEQRRVGTIGHEGQQ